MKSISETLGCLFRGILLIVCIAVISAWLQSQGMSWMDLGKYILDKGGELFTKIGQVLFSMDWRFK
jgi:hypothetical protein